LTVVFWLIVATMITMALLIVIIPLVKKQEIAVTDDTRQRNIQIARDRYAKLKSNKAAGGISQTQYDEQVAELELALSDDLQAVESTLSANDPKQGRWLAYVLMIAIPLVSVSLYLTLGSYQAINRINEPQPTNTPDLSRDDINRMVAQLAAKMQAEPDNLEGWLMLGRSYKVLERYPEAVSALERAYKLADNKPEVLLPYAEALALANQGNWTGKPAELVNRALAIAPQSQPALWYAAVISAQQGDKKTAAGYLRQLAALLPNGSEDQQQIQALIADAENGAGATTPHTPQQSGVTGVSIDIEVSLSPEIKDQVQGNDTVFIYAQALDGPKMPLAIVKKQVSDLPIKITLSDADSVMPAMKLSQVKAVKLLARVSKSGSAMPQPGDLMGEIFPVNPESRGSRHIDINRRLE